MISYRKMFKLRCKGLNMQEIADHKDINVDRVTVNRNFLKLKKMSDKEFDVLFRDVMGLEESNK